MDPVTLSMIGGALGVPGLSDIVGGIGGVLGGLFGGGRPAGWQEQKDQMGEAIIDVLQQAGVSNQAVERAVRNEHFGHEARKNVLLAFQAGDVRGAATLLVNGGVPVDAAALVRRFTAPPASNPLGGSSSGGGESGAGDAAGQGAPTGDLRSVAMIALAGAGLYLTLRSL